MILVCFFFRENDSMTPKPTFDDLKEKFNEKHAKIEVLCNDAIHPSDFFESFKDISGIQNQFIVVEISTCQFSNIFIIGMIEGNPFITANVIR